MKSKFTSARNFKIFLFLLGFALQAGSVMGQSPSVTEVIKPITGIYKAGAQLSFTVNFSEPVIVNTGGGTPYLEVQIGSQTRRAIYTGGSGSQSLSFVYVVATTDVDDNGASLGVRLELNGGTVRDTDGNNANVVLVDVDSNIVYVDGVSPSVVSVSVPAPGYYTSGAVLEFTLQFNERIISNVVTGRAYLDVTIGTSVVRAIFNRQTADALTFSYVVKANDRDEDGIALGNTIVLNGTTIADIAGNAAQTPLTNVGSTNGVIILNRPATNISGVVKSNAPWTLTITFSDAVTGFDISDISATNATLSNFQVVDSKTYTALLTPTVDGGVSVTVPDFVAENIAGAGNQASSRLSYLYDATPPTITSVDVPANGYYKTGDVLNFIVHFSEDAAIFRTPSGAILPVIIGGTQVAAIYVSGNRTNTFTYSYAIKDGDLDNDGIGLGTALQLNGELFTDLSDNALIPTLNGVGNSAQVFVNATTPGVSLSTAAAAIVNAPFNITFTFTEKVTGLDVSEISAVNASVSDLRTTDNTVYTALITPTVDGPVTISLPAGMATNQANVNTASNILTLTCDKTPPQITEGQHFSILQTAATGRTVGIVNATPSPLVNWTIGTEGTSGAFAIDANGVIKVQNSSVLNTLAGTTVMLATTVSDGLNTSVAVPVSIEVLLVNKAPVLNPVQDVTRCAGTTAGTIQLTGASATETDQTYTITAAADQPFFDVLSVDASDVLSYQLKPGVTSGNTTVTVTIQDNAGTNNGGVDILQRTFTFTVNSLPAIVITSDKGASVEKGVIANLTASAGTGSHTYSWSDADGILSGKQTAVLEVKPLANTTYEVMATNSEGCSNNASFSIAVSGVLGIIPNNILTPNGDGKNDKWLVKNLELYPDNEVKIFDRAGRMVYNRRNYSNDWDGTLNGQQLAQGTYYYFLTINNGATIVKGFITILGDRH